MWRRERDLQLSPKGSSISLLSSGEDTYKRDCEGGAREKQRKAGRFVLQKLRQKEVMRMKVSRVSKAAERPMWMRARMAAGLTQRPLVIFELVRWRAKDGTWAACSFPTSPQAFQTSSHPCLIGKRMLHD